MASRMVLRPLLLLMCQWALVRESVCDTAVPAADLRATYARRGYREVGRVDWNVTNYESVVLSKRL